MQPKLAVDQPVQPLIAAVIPFSLQTASRMRLMRNKIWEACHVTKRSPWTRSSVRQVLSVSLILMVGTLGQSGSAQDGEILQNIEDQVSQPISIYQEHTSHETFHAANEFDHKLDAAVAPVLVGTDWYVRTGTMFGIGSDAYDDIVRASWTIQGGASWPVVDLDECWTLSLQFGGGLVRKGSTGSVGQFQATFLSAQEGIEVIVQDAFDITFKEFRMTSLHLAIEAEYHPASWIKDEWRWLKGLFRLGLRGGRIYTDFEQEIAPNLRAVIDDRIGRGLDPSQFTITSPESDVFLEADDSETFVGIFATVGLGLTYHDITLGQWYIGHVTLGFETEFRHDWFDVGITSRNLLSVSTLFSIKIDR